MKQKLILFSVLIVSFLVQPKLDACAFHMGYDVPYGSAPWASNTPDFLQEDAVPAEGELVEERPKPVFSDAAIRASDMAKAKLKNEKDSKDESTDDAEPAESSS